MGHWFMHPNEDEEVLLRRYKAARRIVRPMGENALKVLYFVFCVVLRCGQYNYYHPALGPLLNYLEWSVDKHYDNEDPDKEEARAPSEAFLNRIVLHADDADDERLIELPEWYETVDDEGLYDVMFGGESDDDEEEDEESVEEDSEDDEDA